MAAHLRALRSSVDVIASSRIRDATFSCAIRALAPESGGGVFAVPDVVMHAALESLPPSESHIEHTVLVLDTVIGACEASPSSVDNASLLQGLAGLLYRLGSLDLHDQWARAIRISKIGSQLGTHGRINIAASLRGTWKATLSAPVVLSRLSVDLPVIDDDFQDEIVRIARETRSRDAFIHLEDMKARLGGTSPELSYNIQASTSGLYRVSKWCQPRLKRRRTSSSGTACPPWRTRCATRSTSRSGPRSRMLEPRPPGPSIRARRSSCRRRSLRRG